MRTVSADAHSTQRQPQITVPRVSTRGYSVTPPQRSTWLCGGALSDAENRCSCGTPTLRLGWRGTGTIPRHDTSPARREPHFTTSLRMIGRPCHLLSRVRGRTQDAATHWVQQSPPTAARLRDGKRAKEPHGIEFSLRRAQLRFVVGPEPLQLLARTATANRLPAVFKPLAYLVLSSQ